MTDNTEGHPDPKSLCGGFATAPYTSAQGRREGWSIFDRGVREDGDPHVELKRVNPTDNDTPPFVDDGAAWDHVVARARAGSLVHQQALSLVDPVERFMIEARCGSWPDPSQP